MTIMHTLARTETRWHRLDVRHWDALAHTSVSVLGVLDSHAVEAIDRVVRTADVQQHTLSLELQQISSVTPEALEALLAPHSSRLYGAGSDLDERFAEMRARLTWADQIRRALDEDGFVLYWQPIIELATDTATHYELLLRMLGTDGAVIAPAAFIETAEHFGLVQEIDRWVVRTAIQRLAGDEDGGSRLEVNLSGKSIVDIARGMGMKTIAEFVENAETVEMLREKGVDYSQGYHHGRPEPMTAWVAAAPR